MQLELHIADLLKRHNCVIVPEFGGFIANYESAWINRSRALIFPPHKQILFNGNLTKNDGLLANEVVLKNSVSYPEALDFISVHVNDWRKKLEDGHRIELNEIGFLFLQNNQIVFEQNREVNLLLQAYGLKQVSFVDFSSKTTQTTTSVVAIKTETEKRVLKVVEKERPKVNKDSVKHDEIPASVTKTDHVKSDEIPTYVGMTGKKDVPVIEKETPVIALNTDEEIEEIATETDDPKIIPINPKKKKSRNYKYAVAAAVILPALFYTYWIPMKTDFLNTGKLQVSDLNPFNKQSSAVYVKRDSSMVIDLSTDWKSWEELTASLPENVSVYNLEINEELYIPVRVKSDSEVNAFNQSGAFHLIAGCFSIESNANNFVAELTAQGYPAGIVDKNKGLYRVSAGSFNSETEAESAKDKFKNAGFSGWILKP